MRKLILSMLLIAVPTAIFAQFKVQSDGKIAIQTTSTASSPISINSAGSSSYYIYCGNTGGRSGNGIIRVCEGGILEINGGTLQNADLELIPGCQVIVMNNGRINMASGKTFNAPVGAIVDISHGTIN